MNPAELSALQQTILEFAALEREMVPLQEAVGAGKGGPALAARLSKIKSEIEGLEPAANAAKAKIREMRDAGLVVVQGGKVVLASEAAPAAAPLPELKTNVRGTETLAKKGEVDPEELARSTARAQAEGDAKRAAEQAAVAESVRLEEARKQAELERLAAIAPEPEAPKPAAPAGPQATRKEDGLEALAAKYGPMVPEAPAPAASAAPAPALATGVPFVPATAPTVEFDAEGNPIVKPAETPQVTGPKPRAPDDAARIERGLSAISRDHKEFTENREALAKKFGVARIEYIPQTPEAEKAIGEFQGVHKRRTSIAQALTPGQARGERGRFGSAPKSAATGEGPVAGGGGGFEPVAGRKGFMEAEASDPQMKARRELQKVDFKKEAKALSRIQQDALIDKRLGGPNAVMFANTQPKPIRDQMVEIALLRDRADADIGETNKLGDWAKRVDETADGLRGRGPAATKGRGAVRPDVFTNLRGQAMTTGGSVRAHMLNVPMSMAARATQAKIEEAAAPRSGTLSEAAAAAARGPIPGTTPPAPSSPAAPPAPPTSGGIPAATPTPAPAAPEAPATPPAAAAPKSSTPLGPIPSGGSFTPGAPAASSAPAAPAAPAAGPVKLARDWRNKPISDRQKASLIASGIDEAKLPKTAGEASDLIDEAQTKTGKFKPITAAQRDALLKAGVAEADLPKSEFAAGFDLRELKAAAAPPSAGAPTGAAPTPAGGAAAPAAKGGWRTNPVTPRQAKSLEKGLKAGLITQEQLDAIGNQGEASRAIKYLKTGRRVPKAVAKGAAATAGAAAPSAPSAPAAPAGGAPAAATGPAVPASAPAAGLPNPYKGGKWKGNPNRNAAALAQRAKAMGIGGRGAAGTVGKAAGLMRFLGPLAAIYGGYQVLDLLKQGTLDAADERRLKMMQALGAVGGGAQQQQMMNDQMRQMRFMADMAAIQNQQGLMQSRNQSISDQALSSLLRGHEASLQSLALPSQPSVAEVMARM